MLSQNEIKRYTRQMILPDFGKSGQEKLKRSSVLVVGAGGLGSPALLYLAAAGVGTIGIIDDDIIEESNLHRQVLFSGHETGKSKAECAAEKIQQLNAYINVSIHKERLKGENAGGIIEQYDLVLDGSDNFPTRYLVNDVCVFTGKPCIYGSVLQYEGQVSVFNLLMPDGKRGPNYRDIYQNPPAPGSVPDCSEGGVLGVLPGIIGSMQAVEAIKVLSGIGKPLSGKLLIYNALTQEQQIFNIHPDPDNPVSGKNPAIKEPLDYDAFCGVSGNNGTVQNEDVKQVTVHELKDMMAGTVPVSIIDVREPHEYGIANLGGHLIPYGEIKSRFAEIPRDQKVVVHCASGKRSTEAIRWLQKNGFDNLFNLKGGINAWQKNM